MLALNADMQYQRSEMEFKRGKFRVRGDALEVWPAYEKYAVRVELFGDEIDRDRAHQPDQRRGARRGDRSSSSSRRCTT
jgi:excinuclease ABC subunit B